MKFFFRLLRKWIGKILFDYKEKEKFDINKIHKIIFDQKSNKIGDMLVLTHVIRELNKCYPNIKIDILCGKSNVEVLKENPYINKTWIYKGLPTIKELKKEKYDLLYCNKENIYFKDYYFLNRLGAKINIGINVEKIKLFDEIIESEDGILEIEKYNLFLNIFGIVPKIKKYDIFLTKEEENIFGNSNKFCQRIVFNRFGANKRRTLNEDNSLEILKGILSKTKDTEIYLISPPDKRDENIILKNILNDDRLIIPKINTIRESMVLIEKSDLVISPETSIVHIACAFEKSQIAIYRDRNLLWRPISDKAIIIFSELGKKSDVNNLNVENVIFNILKKLGETDEKGKCFNKSL